MALFSRPERPPADVVAMLPKEERVVSWADVATGGVVLATRSGLWWAATEVAPRLIPWQQIDKAVWRDGVLTVIEADLVDDLLLVDRPALSVQLSKPRDLPPTLRKRVEANVVRSEVHAVDGGAARYVARRIPGRDGVVWWARLEAGTRDTQAVRAQVKAQVEQLKANRAPVVE